MNKEWKSLEEFGVLEPCTWEIAREHGCEKPGGLRWIVHQKPDKMKARIVAQQVNTGEWADTFAATPVHVSQRLLVHRALVRGYLLGNIDIGTAFLHARVQEDMWLFALKPASGVGSDLPVELYRVVRALYGFRVSPRLFQETFAEGVQKHKFKRSCADPQLYTGPNGDLLSAHVDDVLITAAEADFPEVLKVTCTGSRSSRVR